MSEEIPMKRVIDALPNAVESIRSRCLTRHSHAILHILIMSLLSHLGKAQTIPTGRHVPELSRLDEVVQGLLQTYDLPGAALAVVYHDKLVMAKGYGVAGVQPLSLVQPYSRFRIAGVTKAITAVATLKLVEQGRLRLETRLSDILPVAMNGRDNGLRFGQMTIGQLLSHRGSLAGDGADDPARWYGRALSRFGAVSQRHMYHVMADSPSESSSDTTEAFSNVAFELLGRCIEAVTGKTYFDWITESVLRPAGIVSMQLGATLATEQQLEEVQYFDYAGAGLRRAVAPGSTEWLPRPYGGSFLMEYAQAHAGLIGSVIDLAKFVTALDGRRGVPLLAPATFRSMLEPASSVSPAATTYLGKGWHVRPASAGEYDWWSTGGMEGSSAILKTYASGVSYILLFSGRPAASEAPGDPFQDDVERRIGEALKEIRVWPDFDLFQPHPPTIRMLVQ